MVDAGVKAEAPIADTAPDTIRVTAKRHIGAQRLPGKRWLQFGADAEILRRGPNGLPVYDNHGFELDYKKVRQSSRQRRRINHAKMMERDARRGEEKNRKREIMGTEEAQISGMTLMAWDDRISRDLQVPYHKVEMKHFEEWKRRGFRAEPGEFEAKNIPVEEADRITHLATGSAFRK